MGTVVETQQGKLEGLDLREAGIQVFRGIPYAKPPLAERRFLPPEPPDPWPGVRDASAFGPTAPQSRMALQLPGMEVGPSAEDCLYLNVYTPASDGARRPVLFWIHGGAFVIGSGCQAIYDGSRLASRGDVVVVTVNYRLGPLGFLYLTDLCPDLEGAAGNCGLRDQIAALRWVRENIEAFGGDPDRVTIFGESAGAMSVATLLGMPAARGLFRGAIAQSGAAHHFHSRESATQVAAAFLKEHDLSPSRAAREIGALPVTELLTTVQQMMFKVGNTDSPMPFMPLVDDDSLPEPALEAVRGGCSAGITLLAGTTRDEWKLFAMLEPDLPTLDDAGLVQKLGERIREADPHALVETYRTARQGRAPVDPASLFFAIETDRFFRIPAIRLAEAQLPHQPASYLYRFDWESPAFGGTLGACHAVELAFVLGTYDQPGLDLFVGAGPEVEALAGRAMDSWVAFARGGDPNHAELPAWEAYDAERRVTMLIDRHCRPEYDPDSEERRFWDGVL